MYYYLNTNCNEELQTEFHDYNNRYHIENRSYGRKKEREKKKEIV